MNELDVLAGRSAAAARRHAETLADPHDALARARAAAADVVALSDRVDAERDRQRTTGDRASRRGWWAAAAAVAVIAGVGALVLAGGGGGDGPQNVAEEQQSDESAPVSTSPSDGVGVRAVPPGWTRTDEGAYLGGGLTATLLPEWFDVGSEMSGAATRTFAGRTTGSGDQLEAVDYTTVLTDEASGQTITVGYIDGKQGYRRLDVPHSAWQTRDGYTVWAAVSEGLDVDGAASRLLLSVRFDAAKVLDRFDVTGGFGSPVLGAADGSWVVEKREMSESASCWVLRLAGADDGYAAVPQCARTDRDRVFYVETRRAAYVVASLADGDAPLPAVRLSDGSALAWRNAVAGSARPGIVAAQVPSGLSVRAITASDVDRCPVRDAALAAFSDPPFSVLIDECDRSRAVLVVPAADPRAATGVSVGTVVERQADSSWQPVGVPSVSQPAQDVGGGLSASTLPAVFQRPGGLLGGPHRIVGGAAERAYAATWFAPSCGSSGPLTPCVDPERPIALQVGYVAAGATTPRQIGERVVTALTVTPEGSVTLFASSDQIGRSELRAVLDGLTFDPTRVGDDGGTGEFGSVLAEGVTANGRVQWTLLSAGATAERQCFVLTEDTITLPAHDATPLCVPTPGRGDIRYAYVRGHGRYVVAVGARTEKGADRSMTVLDVTDPSALPRHVPLTLRQQAADIAPADRRGDVWATGAVWADAAPVAARVIDVTGEGPSCPVDDLIARDLGDVDGPVEIASCHALALAG